VLVHWDATEAEELAAPFREDGWQVTVGNFELRDLKAKPPVARCFRYRGTALDCPRIAQPPLSRSGDNRFCASAFGRAGERRQVSFD